MIDLLSAKCPPRRVSLIVLQDIVSIPGTDEELEMPKERGIYRKHAELGPGPGLSDPCLGLGLIDQAAVMEWSWGQLLSLHLACDVL